MPRLHLIVAAALLLAAPAYADRPVTKEERAKLEPALKAQGCSGGRMEFDGGGFEVDDAICEGGKKFDLTFSDAFQIIRKKPD